MDFGMRLWARGGKGMLVSGGCREDGSVRIPEGVFREVRELKDRTGLYINLHTGLVDGRTAGLVAWSGADNVSFDLVGDDRAIREVLHLDRTVEDYEKSYRSLTEAGANVTPHILAGLNWGGPSGEMRAVEIAKAFSPKVAVLLVLVPTKGTPMEGVPPMGMEEVLQIAHHMRASLGGELMLGCMRPKKGPSLEMAVLDAGFDGIVLPSRSTVKKARELGWGIELADTCCCALGPRASRSLRTPHPPD